MPGASPVSRDDERWLSLGIVGDSRTPADARDHRRARRVLRAVLAPEHRDGRWHVGRDRDRCRRPALVVRVGTGVAHRRAQRAGGTDRAASSVSRASFVHRSVCGIRRRRRARECRRCSRCWRSCRSVAQRRRPSRTESSRAFVVLLAWICLAWVAAFAGYYFETFERGAWSVVEQLAPTNRLSASSDRRAQTRLARAVRRVEHARAGAADDRRVFRRRAGAVAATHRRDGDRRIDVIRRDAVRHSAPPIRGRDADAARLLGGTRWRRGVHAGDRRAATAERERLDGGVRDGRLRRAGERAHRARRWIADRSADRRAPAHARRMARRARVVGAARRAARAASRR